MLPIAPIVTVCPAASKIPATLGRQPFTRAMAIHVGLTPMALRGKRFRNVYTCADLEMTLPL